MPQCIRRSITTTASDASYSHTPGQNSNRLRAIATETGIYEGLAVNTEGWTQFYGAAAP